MNEHVTIPDEVNNYFEELKVKLAFRMSLMFLIVFLILTYAYYFDSLESFFTMALGVLVSVICLSIVLLKGNYALVFYIYSISGVLVTSNSEFT